MRYWVGKRLALAISALRAADGEVETDELGGVEGRGGFAVLVDGVLAKGAVEEFSVEVGSDAPAVAPEADVESITKAESLVAAGLGEPGGAAVEFRRGASLGHEEDALAGNGMSVAKRLDFHEIGRLGDDEFEPGLR